VEPSAVIIGGGPAGASAGRLLASWGRRVLLLTRPADPRRGLAESLPPSTHKLLATIGFLDEVERAEFVRATGNTVWWCGEGRVEAFATGMPPGFQIFRPDFDRLLLEGAARAGVEVVADATVSSAVTSDGATRVEFECHGNRDAVCAPFVLDCTGRAGVVARRFRQPGHRMFALVGAWRSRGGWGLADPTHTLVEAHRDGWVWSIPTSALERHIGAMVDGVVPRAGSNGLTDVYRGEIAKAVELGKVPIDAELDRVWACDASTYSSDASAGAGYVLVGDAASAIDPLSSFGVKKAIGSGWMAAIVVNTCLAHPDRAEAAYDFYRAWQRDVTATHARRSRDFAREAAARFDSPFWRRRAEAVIPGGEPDTAESDAAQATAALRRIQESREIEMALGEAARVEPRPVIRGHEIVVEDAFASAGRFRDHVDLVALARMAPRHRHVPELYDAYCRASGPAPLPNVLGGLSVLVAKGILQMRSAS
jgi:flavin-dependent dehydrogenase